MRVPLVVSARVPDALETLLRSGARQDRVRHVETVPAREGESAPWPAWTDPDLIAAWRAGGIQVPWQHQVHAAQAAWSGRHVVVSTGTASGKSLAYLMPVLTAVRDLSAAAGPAGGNAARRRRARRSGSGSGSIELTLPLFDIEPFVTAGLPGWVPPGTAVHRPAATALYLAPTKSLAADQLAAITRLGLSGIRAASYDGDTPGEERRWIREHAGLVLTNPDLLHHSLLPGHARWSRFLRSLRFVVIDECHHYRGVFGSHVAAVLRRLRRVAARYGADPVFVLASATAADPGVTAARLTGHEVDEVRADASPRGRTELVLWEPPLTSATGEHGAPTRRAATAETVDLLADLVGGGVQTLAFVPSRRGSEAVAAGARRLLGDVDPGLVERVAAYRGGYLPEERRRLEAALRDGRLTGLATTSALELGVDVAGLDAVLICGWPGRRASLWQQAGRAGRRGRDALAVLIARDDPLDTYLVHHPDAVFGRDVEATVLDPDNPYVLGPHLCAAAAELPLRPQEVELFGPTAPALLADLTRRGLLRRRPTGWFWTHDARAGDLADLRGTGGEPVRVVESATGRLLGTVDAAASHHAVHTGAVYLHQGSPFVVERLDLDEGLALVAPTGDRVWTQAREASDIRVLATVQSQDWGDGRLCLGSVEVSQQVVAFLRRDGVTGEVLAEVPLDLPVRRLRTTAVWWTLPEAALATAGIEAAGIPGAAHAAEHAAIGLLPLVATCDRWDIGGVSTARHPDTGLPTVFVHDGHPGGAGFAERGFASARTWLEATRQLIDDCECADGCPSCVQSPKCGNGNEPLDKAGAGRMLGALLGRG